MFSNNSPAFSRFLLWLIGLGYVAYLIISLAYDIYQGESEFSGPMAIAILVAMSVAEVVLLIFSIRNWKKATLLEIEKAKEEAEKAAQEEKAESEKIKETETVLSETAEDKEE